MCDVFVPDQRSPYHFVDHETGRNPHNKAQDNHHTHQVILQKGRYRRRYYHVNVIIYYSTIMQWDAQCLTKIAEVDPFNDGPHSC